MAEAHSAVAFTFTVTPDGDFDVNLNWVLLEAVWHHIVKSVHRKALKFRNAVHNGVYPLKPIQWLTFVLFVLGLSVLGFDMSHGLVDYIAECRPIALLNSFNRHIAAVVVFSTAVWIGTSMLIRQLFKWLLSYKGWMNDEFGKGSALNKAYLKAVQFISQRSPLTFGLQGSMPNLPLPKLDNTIDRFLKSVEPLHTEEEIAEVRKMAEDFRRSIGPKLQRYLFLKWLTSSNYVSDWWEQYIYLKGRGPIMVNSNFYGLDMMFFRPTHIQAARAANITHFALKFRTLLDREQVRPIYASNSIPLCSWQYERQFNTTRVPGEEIDTLVHHEDSRHIVVMHRGRYFKVVVYSGGRLLQPNELERIFQAIIDDPSSPQPGEEHLAALTAGSRTPWAIARKFYFSEGINRQSLRDVEHAAFVVALDDEEYVYDADDHTKLDRWARAMLHGRCYDRWFDKSFTFCIGKNAACGFNGEHSWADAPIMGHMWEYVLAHDCHIIKYNADGHCTGAEKTGVVRPPIRLQWNLVPACQDVINNSLKEAEALAADTDIHLVPHPQFGKGFMKKVRISPDAFIQTALQLAQYRDQGRFCLTYESSMTRMYREGRTETVRSCSAQSCAFVRAMEDKSVSNEERIALLNKSAVNHQNLYKAAMAGQGCDRHLFTLYVVSRWLGVDSPFLKKAISEPWRLSTSQTPTMQTDLLDCRKFPHLITSGGGFGPVADDGYGVSYIINGEDHIMFHVSSKKSCPKTDSKRMGDNIVKALADMKALFDKK